MTFQEFPKMARLSRECVITEKIDGTNAQIAILKPEVRVSEFSGYVAHVNDHLVWAGSRTRWVTPEQDNYGWAKWVKENAEELVKLGPGTHFGEWWGQGIQRKYGLSEKRFSLFNVSRWCLHGQSTPEGMEELPPCCGLVPILYKGVFDTTQVDRCLEGLKKYGSRAAPGFMNPEGVVVFHMAGNVGFKKTIERDEAPKSLSHPAS